MRTWITWWVAAGVVPALVGAGAACSSTEAPAPGGDGGGAGDGAVADGPAGKCSPQAVANPTGPTPAYRPYLRVNACTPLQLQAFYTACVDAAATRKTCTDWQNDSANRTCGACVLTDSALSLWGAIVSVGPRDAPFNIGGCFGITLNEGANTAGCGAARWALDRCLLAACPIANCAIDPASPTPNEDVAYKACREAAPQSTCAPAANDLSTKCAALNGDASAALIEQNCPLSDTVTLREFTLAITATFCGGGSTDAGRD